MESNLEYLGMTYLGSLEVSFDGFNDGKLEGLLNIYSLGATHGKALALYLEM